VLTNRAVIAGGWTYSIADLPIVHGPHAYFRRCLVILTTIDSRWIIRAMSANTMSFALPEALRSYVDERVRSGQYGNTSEYLRELIRRDQEEQAKKRLRELIEEGLNSGSGRVLTPKVAAQLKERALGGLR